MFPVNDVLLYLPCFYSKRVRTVLKGTNPEFFNRAHLSWLDECLRNIPYDMNSFFWKSFTSAYPTATLESILKCWLSDPHYLMGDDGEDDSDSSSSDEEDNDADGGRHKRSKSKKFKTSKNDIASLTTVVESGIANNNPLPFYEYKTYVCLLTVSLLPYFANVNIDKVYMRTRRGEETTQ